MDNLYIILDKLTMKKANKEIHYSRREENI